MKTVFVSQRKGGAGKGVTCHAIAFGLSRALRPDGQPNLIVLYHTDVASDDEERLIKQEKRPYIAVRGKDMLSRVLAKAQAENRLDNLILIVDGGANRSEFDVELGARADLVVIPVMPTDDSYLRARLTLDTVAPVVREGVPVRFLLNAWPTDEKRRLKVESEPGFLDFYEAAEILTMATRLPNREMLREIANYSVPFREKLAYGTIVRPTTALAKEAADLLGLELTWPEPTRTARHLQAAGDDE
ncbi:ParA family protein [Roseomonas genomospecies 6]|uniref:ParA family protein n=1 Tax=Roseomonas genomospecies 6 TaxID=214106 RepID=A0A9W7KQI3_9PROT|nr:ParA family protein [Roseomonas genomospecies 6]KAA0677652.1 ParA family protein [Roseomonas genomospecies 6]